MKNLATGTGFYKPEAEGFKRQGFIDTGGEQKKPQLLKTSAKHWEWLWLRSG